MCDYSLQHVASRPAAAGQRLVTSRFPGSMTRGFTEVGEPAVAICLLPGTEIAFDREAKAEPNFPLMPKCRIGERVARFRQVALDKPMAHHDALEFANGEIVLLTRLVGRPDSHSAAASAWRSARDGGGRAGHKRRKARLPRGARGHGNERKCLP